MAESGKININSGDVHFDFKINREGVLNILRSPQLQEVIDSKCSAIKSRADSATPTFKGMENKNYYTHNKSDVKREVDNKGFAIGRVAMGNPGCMAHNKKYNTLIKAMM